MDYDLAIVGAGPGGIAAAIETHRLAPHARILLVEAGRADTRRPCPVDTGKSCRGCGGICNVVSGFGGSMHYGDGIKLSLLPSGRRLVDLFGATQAEALCQQAFDLFSAALGDRPALAGAILPGPTRARFSDAGLTIRLYPVGVVGESMLETIIEDFHARTRAVAEVLIETEVVSVGSEGTGYALELRTRGGTRRVRAGRVVIATGRRGFARAAATFRALGVKVRTPTPSVGVRFEMAAGLLSSIGEEHPDLKITQYVGPTKEKVKTFCFCGGSNGGRIKFTRYFDAFDHDIITLDGHETTDRVRGTRELAANFGLLCQLRAGDQVGPFVDRYAASFGGRPAVQSLRDFLGRTLTSPSWHALRGSVPFEPSVADLHLGRADLLFDDHQLAALEEGFLNVMRPIVEPQSGVVVDDLLDQVLVVAPELEFFWDEVVLSSSCETSAPGIYVVGDAAGIAQGAIQAAMMGTAAARAVVADALAA